jgi:hypothetical protein
MPKAGGYSPVSVADKEVVVAAGFAVAAQEKAMQEENPAPARLELVKILSAQRQVVAGMNFRLRLKVKLNSEEKEAVAVVWWQAWRKPDPYRLTSWKWEESDKQDESDAGGGK